MEHVGTQHNTIGNPLIIAGMLAGITAISARVSASQWVRRWKKRIIPIAVAGQAGGGGNVCSSMWGMG